MLAEGEIAPDFELPDHDEKSCRLSELLPAGPVVLYFYPKDHTSGCTLESCSFRDAYADFRAAGVQVVGVSLDGAAMHRSFRDRHQLPFPLLSDRGGRVAALYGVKRTLGVFPGRGTFLIDRGGVIRMAYASQLRAAEHVSRSVEAVRKLAPDLVDPAAALRHLC